MNAGNARIIGLLPLAALIILVSLISKSSSQFISHINAKGLRGNITFSVQEGSDGGDLVIEALLETDRPIVEDESIEVPDILFDWSIHTNSLSSSAIITCSNDDLGPAIPDSLKNNLSSERPIALNKINRWTQPLSEVLKLNSAQSISSLIWGKSIKLRMFSDHVEKNVEDTDGVSALPKPATPGRPTKPSKPGLPAGISRPHVGPIVQAGSLTPSKPTFAPRQKPSISGRIKPTSAPRLPRPEKLVMETIPPAVSVESTDTTPTSSSSTSTSTTTSTTSTTSTTATPKQQAVEKNNADAFKKLIASRFGRVVVCANIIDLRDVKSTEANFETQIAGKVTMRGNEDGTTLIATNLYHVKSKVTTRHDWKILASDILDDRRHEERCRYLEIVFDPNNVDDSKCSRSETSKCRMGDLVAKHGQIQIAGQGKNTRTTLVDLNLPLSALEGSRALFLVIYEVSSSSRSGPIQQRPNILSCAEITTVISRKVEAIFNMDGVRGSVKMSQRHPTEPTQVSYDLFGLEGNIKHLTIHELPMMARTSSDNSKLCSLLGEVFNPYKVPAGADSKSSTFDAFSVGNLSAKHGALSVIDSEYEDHYMGEYTDLSIQLFGLHTVVGRSIVIHKNNGDVWVCSSLDYTNQPTNRAAVTFYYPVVGTISFEQLADQPHSETGVLVELYNPNGEKDSDGHNWMIHLNPAMADFYNWSQRCESSGEVFDPLQVIVGLNNDIYNRQCQTSVSSEPMRCRVGDTGVKSGFKLSLPKSPLNRSRKYYVDQFLPLSKANSIVGRSLVIYDEHAPTQRGNRLACSTIKTAHPLKASVKSWDSGPSIPSAVYGSVIFEQKSPARTTNIKIDLSGFNGNVENYAIHNVWTSDDREFPCSNDSLYDVYDPYDNENSQRLPPSAHYGSLATVDRVRVGDMSRKHGTFEGLQSVRRTYSDANTPLFAPQSIIGRSVVLRAAVNDFRWVCGTIELDYDKGQSREIIGVASFDDPRSKISGYVRFFQLQHKDGSLSDTFIHVDLKLQPDGIHELQTSEGHNWAVFVNQVGADAYIPADEVRCIAAGFKWNPYLAQDKLESYPDVCNLKEPSACAMGDLGSRHGPLTLGQNNRRAVSDSNMPLAGNYSVMGRSLVIFDNKRPNVKLACANIFPDIHLKSNVVIKRTPSFTVSRFIEQMRSLLDAAEWLIVPELRATKPVANSECVQMTIHFYGQRAHQLQVELNNLITLGTVRKSSRSGPEKISTHYKLCRTGQMQLTSSAPVISTSRLNLLVSSLFVSVLAVFSGFCIRRSTTVVIYTI